MIGARDACRLEALPRPAARRAGQRTRSSRGRGLRHGRAGARVRHPRLCGRRRRSAGPRAGIRRRPARSSPRLRCAVRLQGVPVHGRLPGPGRGGTGLRRGLGRGAVSGPARRFRPGPDLPSRQRQVRDRAAGGAGGRGRPRGPRLVRRPGAAGAHRRPPPGGPPARHPRRGRRHPPCDLDRPGRLQVRLLARSGAGGHRAPRRHRPASSWSGCTATSARSCSSSSRSWPRSGRSPAWATIRSTTSVAGSGPPTLPPSIRPR